MLEDIIAAVSNRHLHLSKEDLQTLFGKDYELMTRRTISNTAFAAEETVSIAYNDYTIDNVRIVGPPRGYTQVEILKDDSKNLYGEIISESHSGDISSGKPITIYGPHGSVYKEKAVIRPYPHIHISEQDMGARNVSGYQEVSLYHNEKTLGAYIVPTSYPKPIAHLDKDQAKDLNLSNVINNIKVNYEK